MKKIKNISRNSKILWSLDNSHSIHSYKPPFQKIYYGKPKTCFYIEGILQNIRFRTTHRKTLVAFLLAALNGSSHDLVKQDHVFNFHFSE